MLGPTRFLLAFVLGLLIEWVLVHSVKSLSSCMRGTFMSLHVTGDNICLDCQQGTFMPHDDHTHRSCYNCSKIKNGLEVEVQRCEQGHDAVIQCKDGYFRAKGRNARTPDSCKPCMTCDHVTRACDNQTDTVCCPPHYDAVEIKEGEGVYKCQERPTLCGCGSFFSREHEQCLPCPAGTYMPDYNHTHDRCVSCKTLPIQSTDCPVIIIQHCGACSPTLFSCLEGCYRSLKESLTEPETCFKCTCKLQDNTLRNCSRFDRDNCTRPEVTTTSSTARMTVQVSETPGCPEPTNSQVLLYSTIILAVITILALGLALYCCRKNKPQARKANREEYM